MWCIDSLLRAPKSRRILKPYGTGHIADSHSSPIHVPSHRCTVQFHNKEVTQMKFVPKVTGRDVVVTRRRRGLLYLSLFFFLLSALTSLAMSAQTVAFAGSYDTADTVVSLSSNQLTDLLNGDAFAQASPANQQPCQFYQLELHGRDIVFRCSDGSATPTFGQPISLEQRRPY